MFGADVMVAQPSGFVDCEFDNLLGPRRKPNFARTLPFASADNELNRGANLTKFDIQIRKNFGCHTVCLSNKAEQNMLRANVIMVEPLSFFLR